MSAEMESEQPLKDGARDSRIHLNPVIRIKDGVYRRNIALRQLPSRRNSELAFENELVELRGRWQRLDADTTRLSFTLRNKSDGSIRLARLIFPAENGLRDFLGNVDTKNVSFLRNGYQSWSTARSYRPREKPLRPWLQLVSLASSNLANLPSNIPGIFSSEMYAVITDRSSGDSFLLGQAAPFNQFFYIKLTLSRKTEKERRNYFELVYDFGRKMIMPGEEIPLDGIIVVRGKTETILDRYFTRVKEEMNIRVKETPRRGWCSWYAYYNRITPEIIRENVLALKKNNVPTDYIMIDDGYEADVGDWLVQRPEFQGKMKELADFIREQGYEPGLWIAPFIADRKSELLRVHPEYALKNEYGRRLIGGYGPFWRGRYFYGLDVTYPRFEEYLRKVIRTIVHEWGFSVLKCDFLFGACLRGGNHTDISYSRAEIMKRGMKIIREEAGKDTYIIGCGMPLSAGIGTVDAMRVGPDTGPFWIHRTWKLFRTGAMLGVRNSIRNTFVRSSMNRRLWVNDPDCVMLRERHTALSPYERFSQIHAVILSGGILSWSDDIESLPAAVLPQFSEIDRMSAECSRGVTYALDLMEREIPELIYNTAGYLGVFNNRDRHAGKVFDVGRLEGYPNETLRAFWNAAGRIREQPVLVDVWTGHEVPLDSDGKLVLTEMHPHSSRLFRLTFPGRS